MSNLPHAKPIETTHETTQETSSNVIEIYVEPVEVRAATQPVQPVQTEDVTRMRVCRGCSIVFEVEPNVNVATSAAYRCKKCRGFSFLRFF